MKRSEASIPDEKEILAYDNVPVDVAARFIGWSSVTIYYALQDGRAPFGFAAKGKGGHWIYNISPGLLVKYKRGDLPTYRLNEVMEIAADGVERLVDARLSGLKRVMEIVADA